MNGNFVRQDAQLSQRDRAARCVSFGQNWKTGTGRLYFTDIIDLSSTTWYNRPVELSNSVKKTPFKVIQGHRGQYQSKASYATSYWWLIVTDILSRTVSELLQQCSLLLKFWTLHFWPPLGGGGLGTTCDVHLGLIGKRVVDCRLVLIQLFRKMLRLRCYIQSKIDRISAISLQRDQFDPKF